LDTPSCIFQLFYVNIKYTIIFRSVSLDWNTLHLGVYILQNEEMTQEVTSLKPHILTIMLHTLLHVPTLTNRRSSV